MATYPPCKHCKRPMRPATDTAKQHPGTVGRSTATTCTTCQKAIRQGRNPNTLTHRALVKRLGPALPPRPPHLDDNARHNRQSLEDYIHNRRTKGIPAHGKTTP